MKKIFLSILIAVITSNFLLVKDANANYFGGVGGAVAFSNGAYNPAFFGGPAPFPALWGGGYNLNSLAGGGWGGYPAGYGVPPFAAGLYGGGHAGGFGGGCGNCGALTGGFGGFYSPFLP